MKAFTREHIVPQALGTFENNLTLVNCVCAHCNQFFGDNLEPIVAEGSFEGVLRLERGIKSPASAKYLRKSRMHFSLIGEEWKGLVMTLGGDQNELFVSPVSQVRFGRKDGSGWICFTESELAGFSRSLPDEIETDRVDIVYDSEEAKERLIEMLSKLNVEYQEEDTGHLSSEQVQESRVGIETQIDHLTLRCMAKIAFNYLTKTAGDDFARKQDFDPIRSYIRYGVIPEYDFCEISDYLISSSQTGGHLIAVDWAQSFPRDIVAQVSPFSHRTYFYRLVKGFSGLWRPLRSGHHFNTEKRKVERLK